MPNHRNLLSAMFGLRCPRCREGHMFVNRNAYQLNKLFDMHESCEHCGLKYEREPGFFYGAMYVSYALSIAMAVSIWVGITIFTTLDIWTYIGIIIVALVLSIPYLFRISRTIWLAMFVKYRKEQTT